MLLEFDIIPAGEYILTLQFYESENKQDILDISFYAETPERIFLAGIKLPLRYDMGSNCGLYGVLEEEIEAEWERVYKILDARAKEKHGGDDGERMIGRMMTRTGRKSQVMIAEKTPTSQLACTFVQIVAMGLGPPADRRAACRGLGNGLRVRSLERCLVIVGEKTGAE